MERLRGVFERLARAGRRALIPFVMGGDPSLAMTAHLMLALEDAGADIIEVGVPFSDPLADGPVIQAAAGRALARGVTPAAVLDAVASVRHRLQVPLVLLSYWNPIVQFGAPPHGHAPGQLTDGIRASVRTFVRTATAGGVSGVIVPDLPVEESRLLRAAARPGGLAVVCLAAPTSPPERLARIAQASTGFIYYVSVTGTTGARAALPADLVRGVRRLKRLTRLPVCVGFGISTPAQAARVARVADGVIIGSALIQAIEGARHRLVRLRQAARFVARMRAAI
jgi:tryptophan synthase alpha chain